MLKTMSEMSQKSVITTFLEKLRAPPEGFEPSISWTGKTDLKSIALGHLATAASYINYQFYL
jgi:hypothetical protein